MAISLVGSAFANSSGAGTSTTPTFTLPASIPATDSFAVVIVMQNGTGATLTATGWTVTGPITTANGRAWCCTKTVGSSDSSTSPSFTLSGNNRWSVSGGVWTGVLSIDGVVSTTDDTSGISTLTLAAFTPLSANCVAVALAGGSRAIANANGITTVPAGYGSVLAGAVTNQASANNYETAVMAKQLVGNALNASIAGAWTGNTRDITFVVTLTTLSLAQSMGDVAQSTTISQTLTANASLDPADTGAGSDSASANATLSDADTAAGTDAASVSAGLAPADTASGTDSLTADATSAPADTAVGTDTATTTATAAPGDDGGGSIEALTVATTTATAADTAAGSDALALHLPSLIDVAQSTAISQQLAVVASALLPDVGAGDESLAIVAHAALADTSTGSDSMSAGTAPATPQLADEAAAADGLVVVKSDLILFFRAPTPAHAAAVNPVLKFGEPGWDGVNFKIGPDGGANWNDLPALNGVYAGPTDPGPMLPPGTEYVWAETDGAGTLIGIAAHIA